MTALSSLAPIPPGIAIPRPLSSSDAKDPQRVAQWTKEVEVSLNQHDHALRSYLGNLLAAVAALENADEGESAAVIQNITNIYNEAADVIVTGELGEPVWEWNGVSTSQFAASESWSSGTNTPVLQVVSSANVNQEPENYLEISSTGTGSGGFGFYITEELPFEDEDRGMVVEWVTAPGSTTGYGGFSLMADDADTAHSYNMFIGPTACWTSIVDDGTATLSGTTPTDIWDGAGECKGRIWVRGIKPSGDVPRFTLWGESWPGNSGDGTYSTRLFRRDDFPVEPPGSTWNNIGCRKIGLSLQASGGNNYGAFRLTEMRVYLLRR